MFELAYGYKDFSLELAEVDLTKYYLYVHISLVYVQKDTVL